MGRVAAWALLLVSVGSFAASSEDIRLIQAVKDSNASAVRSLLQMGANANAREADGTTALHWAVSRNDLKTIDVLIGAGADVKAINRFGVSPLLIASSDASMAVVER